MLYAVCVRVYIQNEPYFKVRRTKPAAPAHIHVCPHATLNRAISSLPLAPFGILLLLSFSKEQKKKPRFPGKSILIWIKR